MSLDLFAHLALGLALLLALGFHRHRAAQVALLLWLLLAGTGAEHARWEQAALRFAPWLVLLAVLMPEPRLLSRRHAAFLLLVALAVVLGVSAPPHVLAGALVLASLPGLDMDTAAASLLMLAAGVCALRGLWRSQPMELGLAGGLLLAALGCLQSTALPAWLLAAALLLTAAIGYTGYRMAFRDTLTGLPNRRALDETLSRLSGGFALAMVDVDHFKAFNDTHGHDAGDVVLRAVAEQLARHAGGRAHRYGGEEFCVVYPGCDAREAGRRLEQARAAIEVLQLPLPPKPGKRGKGKPVRVSVTVSGGCAERSAERRLASEVLKAADQALYKAKAKGRNRVLTG
jgi:diguanylate cyclase (GGDEF)-like protein